MLLSVLFLSGCSPMNKKDVQDGAAEKWAEVGFAIQGYEGYQWGFWGPFGYGGAKVWYNLRRIPDNGITYTGYLVKWGDELQVYGPEAIDAIKPSH
jgi:hypothetical protein